MKACLPLLTLLLIWAATLWQTPQTNKIVYLKDGTNVKGTVTVNDSAGYVMVVEPDHETHYYAKNLVAKVDDVPHYAKVYDLKDHGYVCNVDFGATTIFAKDGGYTLNMFSMNIVNSYLFSPVFSIGGGVGIDVAGSTQYNIEMLSVYGNCRVYFMKANISPFADLSYGFDGMFIKYSDYYGSPNYNYTNMKDRDPGMMLNPCLGMRLAVGKRVALTLALGYRLFYIQNKGSFNQYTYDATFFTNSQDYYIFHSMTFKGGVLF